MKSYPRFLCKAVVKVANSFEIPTASGDFLKICKLKIKVKRKQENKRTIDLTSLESPYIFLHKLLVPAYVPILLKDERFKMFKIKYVVSLATEELLTSSSSLHAIFNLGCCFSFFLSFCFYFFVSFYSFVS